jgi:hypothetical protein
MLCNCPMLPTAAAIFALITILKSKGIVRMGAVLLFGLCLLTTYMGFKYEVDMKARMRETIRRANEREKAAEPTHQK